MLKSSESELSRLRKENEEQRKALATLSAQLSESLAGNKELRDRMRELQQKLDILLVQYKKRNRKEFGPKTERRNPQNALEQTPAQKQPKAIESTDEPAEEGGNFPESTFPAQGSNRSCGAYGWRAGCNLSRLSDRDSTGRNKTQLPTPKDR